MTRQSMTDAALVSAAFALVAGAAILYWQDRKKGHGAPDSTQATRPGQDTPGRGTRPGPSYLPVMHYDELVTSTNMAGRIAKIEQKLAFAPNNFRDDVLPLLQRFSEFVQLLPASESHHHAQPGGLLIHLLEVAEYALHFRDSYKLPIGTSTEEQARLGARYSYAVLVAALLHDIGKPVADIRVRTVGSDNGEPRAWTALAGSMIEQRALWYSVEFPTATERDYKAHQRLPVILLQRIVPGSTLAWLGEYAPLLQEIMSYLGGEESAKDGMIATIVKRADSFSVADNLKSGSRIRFASATAVPLIERLMRGLRDLLAQGGLSLNRPGAAGFCDGEHLWFVAGTLADAVREYLDQTEQRLTGAAKLPMDNLRFFDTWQEYGAVVPNSSGTSIWEVSIKIGTWSQKLRVLKFDLKLLFGDGTGTPSALPNGAISALDQSKSGADDKATRAAPRATAALPSTSIHPALDATPADGNKTGPVSQELLPDAPSAAVDPDLQIPETSEKLTASFRAEEPYPDFDDVDGGSEASSSHAPSPADDTTVSGTPAVDRGSEELAPASPRARGKTGSTNTPTTVIAAGEARPISEGNAPGRVSETSDASAEPSILDVLLRQSKAQVEFLADSDGAAALQQSATAQSPSVTLQPPMRPKQRDIKNRATRKKSRPNAELLLAWIQQGIADGSVLFNESKGFVHFVADGMVLVSPRVFVEFAIANADRMEVPEEKANSDLWRVAQADFQASSYPVKGANNSYLHRYVVSGPHSSVLNANLVPEPDRFFNPVPQPNPLLERMEKSAPVNSRDKSGTV